jgi:hypothetical protein
MIGMPAPRVGKRVLCIESTARLCSWSSSLKGSRFAVKISLLFSSYLYIARLSARSRPEPNTYLLLLARESMIHVEFLLFHVAGGFLTGFFCNNIREQDADFLCMRACGRRGELQ